VTRLGLLVVRGHAMETLAKITDCVFDKTGTLTTGIPHLADIKIVNAFLSTEDALQIAAALEQGHNHPLAQAILRAAQEKNIEAMVLKQLPVAEVGKGIVAGHYRLGSAQWLGIDLHDYAIPAQYSPVCLVDETGLLAIFMLSDTVREGALDLLQHLKTKGVRVHLVSGDHPATVAWWAQHLGISAYQGAVLPEQKYEYLNHLQASGAVVAAIGDGVNDAPLLAKANISIAVGSGAPLAQAGSDAILTQSSLKVISQAMTVAERGKNIMQQNLVWAFIYNVVAIPVAMLGWVNPWIAGIGMSLSSLAVTMNAWRLRKIT
jgi:Cu2+-exporting ATPase